MFTLQILAELLLQRIAHVKHDLLSEVVFEHPLAFVRVLAHVEVLLVEVIREKKDIWPIIQAFLLFYMPQKLFKLF